jgi:hypothetical protein
MPRRDSFALLFNRRGIPEDIARGSELAQASRPGSLWSSAAQCIRFSVKFVTRRESRRI